MDVYDYYITPEEYDRAAKNGISRDLLNRRVRCAGWSKERAITTPARKGSKYQKWIDLAEENGILKKQFLKRIEKGWDPEKAATKPIGKPGKPRKYSKEDIQAAAAIGVSYDTFKFRIYRKWSVEKAKSTPVLSFSECGRRAAETTKARYGNLFAPIFEKRIHQAR